jgi:HAD superfamily phosphatase
MMKMPALWQRPGLQFPRSFDTIFFDVDGVLIETLASFHATDIAVAEYVVGTLRGLDWGQSEHKPLVTPHDVDAFKRAGGFNNDWHMSYLLVALFTARLREWRGTPLAERSIEEWAALARSAGLQGRGGLAWASSVIPASAWPDYQQVGDLYHEYYWGAEELRKRFGYEPRYLPAAPGFVHNETLLYAPDFQARLRAAGVHHMGMITGRVGPEVDSALERMEAYSHERWWEVVISADICAKPDPRALQMAIDAVGARGGLFIGDTADDHDLVRRYQAEKHADAPEWLAAMLVQPGEADIYKERGADIIVRSVEDVLLWLPGRDRITKFNNLSQTSSHA